MKILSSRQHQIFRSIKQYKAAHGIYPSIRDTEKATGINRMTIQRELQRMVDIGILVKTDKGGIILPDDLS